MRHRRYKILATAVVAIVGVGFLAFASLGDVEYYMHVDKLMENPAKWQDKKVIQVHGFVVPGTIEEKVVAQKTERTFRLENKGKEILVRHAGSKPDTFKDQAETVVKGKLHQVEGAWVLQAIEGEAGIMAKCPSKYEGRR